MRKGRKEGRKEGGGRGEEARKEGRKERKILIGMKKLKLSLFVDDLVVYVENPMEATNKVTKLK